MTQTLVIGNYTFTNTDGVVTGHNNVTNSAFAASTKGEFKIMGKDNKPVKYTTAELLAMTGWTDAAAETAPGPAPVTAEILQDAIDQAQAAITALPTDATDEVKAEAETALHTAQDALKTFNRNIKISAIKASVKETATKNASAQQPLLDAANAAKTAMQAAMMDDNVTLESLASLRNALKSANVAVESFVPIIDPNIAEIDEQINTLTDQIEELQDELREYKKLKSGATGKKVSEGSAGSSDRQEYPDFTYEMGEKCRQMKADGKTADETMAAVNCSYGSYQRSIGKAKDGFKPYHPVYAEKDTQVEIPAKKA